MSEILASILSVAVSNLHLTALKEHEDCFSDGKCLYHWNAACAEQVMRQCEDAQSELAMLILD